MAPYMKARTVKALAYAALAVICFVLVMVYQNGVNKTDRIDVSYFQAQRWLLIVGAVCLGVGVSIRRIAAPDAWFLSLLGGGMVVSFLVLFLLFGGISGGFDAAGYGAANAQMLILDGVAIAFLVRGAALSAGLRDADRSCRITVRVLCAVLAFAMVCLMILGYGTRFAVYDETAEAYAYVE